MKYVVILLFFVITGCQCHSNSDTNNSSGNEHAIKDSSNIPKEQKVDKTKPVTSDKQTGKIYKGNKGSLSDTAAEAPVHH
jgi:hypothetical protein